MMLGRDKEPTQEELMERQSRLDRHSMQLQNDPQHRQDVLQSYIELVGSEINSDTLDILNTLVAKDFALANLSEADINELKFLRPIAKLKLEAIHPGESTLMQGEVRRLVYTDNGSLHTDARPLEPIDAYEDMQIDAVLEAAHSMATRSKGMRQWEEFGKSVSVSEIHDKDENNDGWMNFK